MFRTISKLILPNPLDSMLKKTRKKGGRKILLGWNRGLGDIALGLFAIVHRIYEIIPDAQITFMARENLKEGFSMLEGVHTIFADWKRGEKVKINPEMQTSFDLVIENPSPTDWVYWQRGKLTPRLKWNGENEALYEKFQLDPQFNYIGVQVEAETSYGLWRNWPLKRWNELFSRLELAYPNTKIILFGFAKTPPFSHKNIIDLRGKTTLFELISIVKNRCTTLILPDSGISSMIYYLDVSFPIQLISLWADPNHGILKQAVASPNPLLKHDPVIAKNRNLALVSVDDVLSCMFPVNNVGVILLAGGQGSRLGVTGPKGLFKLNEKTLFAIFCEKLPPGSLLAIQTSPLNHAQTVAYFKKMKNFGLEIHFFQQEMEPFLDENKQVMKEMGPNGNGSLFRAAEKAQIGELFEKRGIQFVTVNYIENPLAKPLDPIFCHLLAGQDVAVQCIERTAEDAFMGALVEKEGRLEMIEYTELDPNETYRYAYSGQMGFRLSFFRHLKDVDLPLHWVEKTVGGRRLWKGEKFIFDCLPYAGAQAFLVVPRQTHYAPVKSLASLNSVLKQMKEYA